MANADGEYADLELQGRFSAEFRRAESTYVQARRLQVSSGFFAALGVFLSSVTGPLLIFGAEGPAVYAITLAALALTAWWVLSMEKSKAQRAIAEEARRSYMLHYGLGHPISKARRSNLMASFSSTRDEGKRLEDERYFATREKAGALKLRDITQENVFWSRWLCVEAAQVTWLWFAAFLGLAIFLLLALPMLPQALGSRKLAQMVCVLLSMLLTVDLLTRAVAYQRAVGLLNVIEIRLDSIVDDGALLDTLELFADYNSIIEATPTVPTAIYLRCRDRLNALWGDRARP